MEKRKGSQKNENINDYDMSFLKNMEELEKDKNKFKFKAFNNEDIDENYSKIL